MKINFQILSSLGALEWPLDQSTFLPVTINGKELLSQIKRSLRSVWSSSILQCLSTLEKTSSMRIWLKDLLIFKTLIKTYSKWWLEIHLRVLQKTFSNSRNFCMKIAIFFERTTTFYNDSHWTFICNWTRIQKQISNLSCPSIWYLEVSFQELMNKLLMQMTNALTSNSNINSSKV